MRNIITGLAYLITPFLYIPLFAAFFTLYLYMKSIVLLYLLRLLAVMDASILLYKDRIPPAPPSFPIFTCSLHRISLFFYFFFSGVVNKYASEFAPFYDKINSRTIKIDDDVHKNKRNIKSDSEKDGIAESVMKDDNLCDNNNFFIGNNDPPNSENLAISDQPSINIMQYIQPSDLTANPEIQKVSDGISCTVKIQIIIIQIKEEDGIIFNNIVSEIFFSDNEFQFLKFRHVSFSDIYIIS
jgi:hypothetical protein